MPVCIFALWKSALNPVLNCSCTEMETIWKTDRNVPKPQHLVRSLGSPPPWLELPISHPKVTVTSHPKSFIKPFWLKAELKRLTFQKVSAVVEVLSKKQESNHLQKQSSKHTPMQALIRVHSSLFILLVKPPNSKSVLKLLTRHSSLYKSQKTYVLWLNSKSFVLWPIQENWYHLLMRSVLWAHSNGNHRIVQWVSI